MPFDIDADGPYYGVDFFARLGRLSRIINVGDVKLSAVAKGNGGMLVLTGIMLGFVLLVMVGEQAQEMQLAHWIPATPIRPLVNVVPAWMGVWFSVFPTVETILAQLIAAALVLGFYFVPRLRNHEPMQNSELASSNKPKRPVDVVNVDMLEPTQSAK